MMIKGRPIFKKFVSDFSFSFLLKIGSMGMGLLVTGMLARRLGVDGFGTYSVACALIMLFQVFVQFNVRGIVVRDVRSGRLPIQKAAETVLYLVCFTAPIVYLILLGAGYLFQPGLLWLLAIGGLSYFLHGNRSLNIILHARGRIKTETFVNTLVVAFNCLLIFLFLNKGGNISTVFLCGLGAVALALVYQNYAVSREVRIRVRKHPAEARYLIRESWPLVFSALVQLIHSRADLFMLDKFELISNLSRHLPLFPSGEILTGIDAVHQVGVYAGAYRFFEMPIFIPTYILATGYPILAGLMVRAEFKAFLKKLFLLLGAGAVLVMVVLYFGARPLVDIVLGNNFSGSIGILQVFVWGIPAMMIRPLFRQVMIIRKSQKHFIWIMITGLVLNLILNLYFIPLYGAAGAAAATVISESLTAGLIIFIGWRTVENWNDLS